MPVNNPLPTSPHRYIFWLGCCVFFFYFSLSLTALDNGMFGDTDPLWHIAAGDLIRDSHAIPQYDPWSFTAGNYRWLNIAWGWDVVFSALREPLGWHGIVAINAMIVALIITLIYASCQLRSGNALASIITAVSAITMLSVYLRPLQITNLMVAVWLLLLGTVLRGHIRVRWLALLPVLMVVWVNAHGGFIVGPLLLGAFLCQALHDKRHDLARALSFTLIATLVATLCNPYGIGIFEAVRRPLTTVANQFIREWQPFTASMHNIVAYFYAVAFIALVPRRPLPLLGVERWLAYLWLVLGLTSNRYLSIFAIAAAPAIACSLQQLLSRLPPSAPLATMRAALLQCYNHKTLAVGALVLCLGLTAWLPGPAGARAYHQENLTVANLDPELDFIRKHYAKTHILNHFNLGAIIAYQTHGEIPVFVDPRTETAFPAQILKDYLSFYQARPGWEDIFDRYDIGAVLLPNDTSNDMDAQLYERFRQRQDWKVAFKGPSATLFVRQP